MAIQVTLIFTQHKANGACSSDALLQLIEAVNPEVIFEELSFENYRLAYEELSLNNLESVAIRKYLAKKAVKHIPVDTYEPPLAYHNELDSMYEKFLFGAGEYSFRLKAVLDQKESWINYHGFQFLNSPQNELLFDQIEVLKEKALKNINNDKLFLIAQTEKEVQEKREDAILDNSYRYCKENIFSQGLMFIGSGHQKSIKKKIQERIAAEEFKINWSYLQESLIT